MTSYNATLPWDQREPLGESLSGGDVNTRPGESPRHQEDELVVVIVVSRAARTPPASQQIWQVRGLPLGGVAAHHGGVEAVTNDVESPPSLLSNTAGEAETLPVSRRRTGVIMIFTKCRGPD